MKNLKFRFLAFLVTLFATLPLAHAGMRAPIFTFIDISTQAPYQDGAKLFSELYLSRPSEEFGTVLPVPASITADKIRLAIAGDTESRNEIQQILYDSHFSMDGLIVYLHEEGKVTIYGIPAIVGESMSSVERPVRNFLRLESLDQMITEAMADTFPMRNP